MGGCLLTDRMILGQILFLSLCSNAQHELPPSLVQMNPAHKITSLFIQGSSDLPCLKVIWGRQKRTGLPFCPSDFRGTSACSTFTKVAYGTPKENTSVEPACNWTLGLFRFGPKPPVSQSGKR